MVLMPRLRACSTLLLGIICLLHTESYGKSSTVHCLLGILRSSVVLQEEILQQSATKNKGIDTLQRQSPLAVLHKMTYLCERLVERHQTSKL